MRRPLALPAAVAALGVSVLAYLGLTGFAFTDYDDEVSRPIGALVGGHVHDFLASAPAYGGSLLLRSPFALLPGLWGGGELAVYRLLAVPCLLAAMVLALVLVRTRETRAPGARWAGLVALVVAGNPVTLRALEIGHPEELLGAVLCVGAVLAGIAQRPRLAGLLLGLAIGNKLWAVVAIAPVLLALEDRRTLAAVTGAAAAAVLILPFALSGGAAGGSGAGTHTGAIFQPWQLWWPLGHLGDIVRGIDGHIKPGYRTPPGWLGPLPHPMIAGMGLPAAIAWIKLRPAGRRDVDALLLLALLMLARCVIDPWDAIYYHLPFLLALAAWESVRSERPPVLALTASVLVWVTFDTLPGHVSPDAQCAFYLGWALPALAAMAWHVFALPLPRRQANRRVLNVG